MTNTASEALARLRALNEARTKGEWQIHDSCSWRRIGTPERDGNVLCPITQKDGHPDLMAGRGENVYDNLRAIVAALNALGPLLDAVEALAECADDLEVEVTARWTDPDGTVHPRLQRKLDRDMEPVRKARAALDAIAKLEGK